MSKKIFLDALSRKDNCAGGPGTSIVSTELMQKTGIFFPDAHLQSDKMAVLAEAGHTIYGFDVVMPLFSTWHDAAALGSPVNWGTRSQMPYCEEHIWKTPDDIVIPRDFEKRPPCQVPLDAIGLLKKRLGSDAAVCGKVFGPWTLAYHLFGIEFFLLTALDEPDTAKRILEKLTHVTLRFAAAQAGAGADCLLLGDHVSADMCSPDMYHDFLAPIHAELSEKISIPLILHTCGRTADRIKYIRETGIPCFHYDTQAGTPSEVRGLAGTKLSLMGGLNNPDLLRLGTEEQITQAVQEAFSAGIDIIAPECAVPLDTPCANLKSAGQAVLKIRKSKPA